jgi:hypothetical protein
MNFEDHEAMRVVLSWVLYPDQEWRARIDGMRLYDNYECVDSTPLHCAHKCAPLYRPPGPPAPVRWSSMNTTALITLS